jgi:hypothetical protein
MLFMEAHLLLMSTRQENTTVADLIIDPTHPHTASDALIAHSLTPTRTPPCSVI